MGTPNSDSFFGLAGNDRLECREGDDGLEGGPGADTIIGGPMPTPPEQRVGFSKLQVRGS